MSKKETFGVAIAGSLLVANSFVSFPVFAAGPVDIQIIELVDDGSGGYKAWEDITDAMPGMTYSAIPRVRNNGGVVVSVKMCLSESAVDSGGGVIALPANTFQIEIGPHWMLESGSADAGDPASGNCYNYDSEVPAGEITEPLFNEVTLNGELGNEYRNSTFSLHLEVDAMGEEEEDDGGGVIPTEPDTGANTAIQSFAKYTGITFLSAGILALVITAIRKKILKK